jgi:hypothetical protein
LAEVLQIVNRSVLSTPALASSGADFETIKLDWPLQPRLEMGTVEAWSGIGEGASVSAFDEHKEELEHYEQMMGTYRGRLAVSLDRLTNAMVLVGQHGVYCHSNRDPEKPTMDIQLITQELRKAKELIQSVMEELRAQRENAKRIR